MADISKITIESGTYDIKDAIARNAVNRLNLLINKKVIMIGDSYAEGYSPDGNVTSWCEWMKTFLGLSNEQCIIKYLGGTGFCATVNSRNFVTLLDEISADSNVTDIVVCGGYNDRGFTAQQIELGMTNFKSIASNKFPNATIHLGFIGWTTNTSNMLDLSGVCDQYIQQGYKQGFHFMTNCQFTLHNYSFFSSDGIHPNSTGSYNLGEKITQCFLTGSCDVIGSYNNMHIKNQNSSISVNSLINTLGSQQINGTIQISLQGSGEIQFSTPQNISGQFGVFIKIGDIDYQNYSTFIVGDSYGLCKSYLPLIIRTTSNVYYNANGYLYFREGSLYLKIFGMINDTRDSYLNIDINQIQILDGTQATFDAFLC